ncbi:MAG TPA: spore germination protein GerW family protein [Gemmatimonadaceae bacterium]
MSSPAPFGPIADLLSSSLNIRHVYGEPVQQGDTTVIPVAKVTYGFGAGGGRGPGGERTVARDEGMPAEDNRAEAEGAGGGGGVRMTPVGALEIGPRGTRFIRFHPLAPWFGAAALGLAVGWLLARRRD